MMITEKYKRFLKSPEWQAIRNKAFRYYGRKCSFCGKYKRVLQVHHASYRHIFNPPMSDLRIACVECHKRVTAFHRANRRRGIERNTAIMIKKIRQENNLL